MAASRFEGDYDAYEDLVESELRQLTRASATAVGWAVCEQLFQVVDHGDVDALLAEMQGRLMAHAGTLEELRHAAERDGRVVAERIASRR